MKVQSLRDFVRSSEVPHTSAQGALQAIFKQWKEDAHQQPNRSLEHASLNAGENSDDVLVAPPR